MTFTWDGENPLATPFRGVTLIRLSVASVIFDYVMWRCKKKK